MMLRKFSAPCADVRSKLQKGQGSTRSCECAQAPPSCVDAGLLRTETGGVQGSPTVFLPKPFVPHSSSVVHVFCCVQREFSQRYRAGRERAQRRGDTRIGEGGPTGSLRAVRFFSRQSCVYIETGVLLLLLPWVSFYSSFDALSSCRLRCTLPDGQTSHHEKGLDSTSSRRSYRHPLPATTLQGNNPKQRTCGTSTARRPIATSSPGSKRGPGPPHSKRSRGRCRKSKIHPTREDSALDRSAKARVVLAQVNGENLHNTGGIELQTTPVSTRYR